MSAQILHKRTLSATGILWLFVGLVLTLGVLGSGIANNGFAWAWSLATTQQPERYTQLYFENPAHLPNYAPARKVQTIAFHIANHEDSTQTYLYQITRAVAGSTSVERGSATIRNGQDVRVVTHFTIPKPLQIEEITITLSGRTESLTFRSQS